MQPAKLAIQRPHFLYINSHNRLSSTKSSDKLFADAALEEDSTDPSNTKTKPHAVDVLGQKDENWTGDERIEDIVLRMLVDKYKPLRGSRIVTAEEKLKQAPPKILSSSTPSTSYPVSSSPSSHPSPGQPYRYIKPRSGSWATEPLLPSNEGHKPWETTFKAPSHDGPVNIKLGSLQSSSTSKPALGIGGLGGLGGSASLDERLVKKEKEKMKKAQQAGRLSQAVESTLDYRLGIKHGKGLTGRPNPVSMKGWNSFIEERIQVSVWEVVQCIPDGSF
jgi:DnaJ family protein C protein 28